MHRIACIAAIAALCAAAAGNAGAYDLSGFGGTFGYTTPEHLRGTATFSAHAEFERTDGRISLTPSLGYWTANDVHDVTSNFDLHYRFNRDGAISPYLGTGVGVHFIEDQRFNQNRTHAGMNLIGGLRFPGGASYTFMEARYTASGVDEFAVVGGITLKTY